jgi:hypothetical protein
MTNVPDTLVPGDRETVPLIYKFCSFFAEKRMRRKLTIWEQSRYPGIERLIL